MKANRLTVNLKLGLIIFAVLIAVVSLVYSNQLVDRLRARDSTGMQIWAEATALLGRVPSNPHQERLLRLEEMLESLEHGFL